MAELSFAAYTTDNSKIEIANVLSYELSRDIDAPCDSLRLHFISDGTLDEIVKIEAYQNEKLVFNGYADTQRETIDEKGHSCFVYARSSACILLDNEAVPRSYSCPTSQALFINNAKDFGFTSRLPMYYLALNYIVGKGTSCYGAINNFIKGITGRSIIINAENELVLPEGEGSISLDDYEIISSKKSINRGGLISKADYKIEGDLGYSHHIKSRFLEKKGVQSSKMINLSSLPVWQREYVAKNVLSTSCLSYYKLDFVLSGCVPAELYSNAIGKTGFGELESYYVTGVCIILDSKGERTKLSLCKRLDLEEITYVAE